MIERALTPYGLSVEIIDEPDAHGVPRPVLIARGPASDSNSADGHLLLLGHMERGVKTPTLATIVRLAVALRCKVTDLVAVFNKHDLSKLLPPR